jgi:hypothetical protein
MANQSRTKQGSANERASASAHGALVGEDGRQLLSEEEVAAAEATFRAHIPLPIKIATPTPSAICRIR